MHKRVVLPLLLFLAPLALLLVMAGTPRTPYFDEEVYIEDGRAIFSPSLEPENVEHPPFGKFLTGLFMEFTGDNPRGWRLLSILSTAFLILSVYLISCKVFSSTYLSLLPPLLLFSDPMILVSGKMALLDMPLTLFLTLSAISLSLGEGGSETGTPFLLLTALFTGIALSIKWTGLAIFPAILLFYFIRIEDYRNIRLDVRKGMILFLLPILIYLSTYPLCGYSLKDALRLQWDMAGYHTYHFFSTPQWDSKWYEWMILREPIWFFFRMEGGVLRVIAGLGSPLFWLSGLFSCIYAGYRGIRTKAPLPLFLFLFPFSQFLMWAFALRMTFIYYMTPILPFYALATAYTLEVFLKKGWSRIVVPLASILLIFSISWTLLLSPLISGAKLIPSMEKLYFSPPIGRFVVHSNFSPERVRAEMKEEKR